MCDGPLESGLHLCLMCPLAQEIWGLIITWEHYAVDLIRPQTQPVDIGAWWEQAAATQGKGDDTRRRLNGVVIYMF